MTLNEFVDLIKENSEKGISTEFMKLEMSADDPRKNMSQGMDIEETFSVKYNKTMDRFFVYYPDKDKEITVLPEDIDKIFSTQRWGMCIHR